MTSSGSATLSSLTSRPKLSTKRAKTAPDVKKPHSASLNLVSRRSRTSRTARAFFQIPESRLRPLRVTPIPEDWSDRVKFTKNRGRGGPTPPFSFSSQGVRAGVFQSRNGGIHRKLTKSHLHLIIASALAQSWSKTDASCPIVFRVISGGGDKSRDVYNSVTYKPDNSRSPARPRRLRACHHPTRFVLFLIRTKLWRGLASVESSLFN